jgi:hypothetical protein
MPAPPIAMVGKHTPAIGVRQRGHGAQAAVELQQRLRVDDDDDAGLRIRHVAIEAVELIACHPSSVPGA